MLLWAVVALKCLMTSHDTSTSTLPGSPDPCAGPRMVNKQDRLGTGALHML